MAVFVGVTVDALYGLNLCLADVALPNRSKLLAFFSKMGQVDRHGRHVIILDRRTRYAADRVYPFLVFRDPQATFCESTNVTVLYMLALREEGMGYQIIVVVIVSAPVTDEVCDRLIVLSDHLLGLSRDTVAD